jgi:hypothetical protein
MRTVRGYCRMRARREVYKAYNAYNKGKHTYEKPEVDYKDDYLAGLVALLVMIIFLESLFNL